VLEDLQYLLNRILNRNEETAANVIVDVEGYRQKEKQDFLGRIRELADQVRQTGRPMVLAPMNSFDRRLVHQAFAEDPEISTQSEEGTARLKPITLALRSLSGETTST
jgi:spoIIIJ-associated protein